MVNKSNSTCTGQLTTHWIFAMVFRSQKTEVSGTIIHKHTHTRLTALFPGLPRWACNRKVKPIWILLKQKDSEWQWHQLGHMQVCTLLQTDNHASTPPRCFLQAGCPSWSNIPEAVQDKSIIPDSAGVSWMKIWLSLIRISWLKMLISYSWN